MEIGEALDQYGHACAEHGVHSTEAESLRARLSAGLRAGGVLRGGGRLMPAARPRKLQRVYVPYEPGQRCSVARCEEPSVCTVSLTDYYPELREWFQEQDFTCPCLCERHRRGNGCLSQRYTNGLLARGWSEYWPLEAASEGQAQRTRPSPARPGDVA
jgi:hypothetical protein